MRVQLDIEEVWNDIGG